MTHIVTGGSAVVGGVELTWGSCTHPGNQRERNEDALLAAPGLFLVADGMGGHDAGDVASALAVDVFAAAVSDAGSAIDIDVVERLVGAANVAIRDVAGTADHPGMGTTIVGMAVVANGDDHSLLVFHVGDSRCYRLANDELVCVTTDHSHVQELVAAGELTDQSARDHPMRNVVTRALGSDGGVTADYSLLVDEPARVLLCSDGLWEELTHEQIAAHLSGIVGPQEAAERLVASVLEGAAGDNLTALVVDVALPQREDDVTQPRGQWSGGHR